VLRSHSVSKFLVGALFGVVVLGSVIPASPGLASETDPPGLEKKGLLLEPYVFEDGEPVKRLNPDDFKVRLVGADDPEHRVLDFPAGEKFSPPAGRWRVWLEGPGWMTPFTDLLITGGPEPNSTRARKMPVIPAGRVQLPAGFNPSDEVRLLYAGGGGPQNELRMELTRRVSLSTWPEDGVLMPEGEAVAFVWRPEEERYVALSRPLEVAGGETITPSFSSPKEGAGHLIVYADRGRGTGPADARGLSLRLTYPSRTIDPDVMVITGWGGYAIWYDLPTGDPELSGESEKLVLPAAGVSIDDGVITRVGVEMAKALFTD